jgi:hypothetical protein
MPMLSSIVCSCEVSRRTGGAECDDSAAVGFSILPIDIIDTKVPVKSLARLVDAAYKLTRIQPPLGSKPL